MRYSAHPRAPQRETTTGCPTPMSRSRDVEPAPGSRIRMHGTAEAGPLMRSLPLGKTGAPGLNWPRWTALWPDAIGHYALPAHHGLKLLSDLEVQLCDTFVEFALAAILGADRQIKVFLGVAESRDQLGLGIDHHEDTPPLLEDRFRD